MASTAMSDEPMMAGGVPVLPPLIKNMYLNMLIWGDSGSGKTTLAATAPGKKLILLFDPGGDLSLAGRDDVLVLNLTNETAIRVMTQFRAADPYGLDRLLAHHPEVETVIVDSMTALAYIALQEAVARAGGSKISLEQPGMQGYAYRNASLLRITTAIMRVCGSHKRHLILVTHEGSADRDADGHVVSISMALSEGVANQVGLRFNEVWNLTDTGAEHRIAVRPCRMRKPMKTRLFSADKPEFVWHYNPDTQVGEGIADWYSAWCAGDGKRLPLPSRAPTTTSKGVSKK